MYEKYFKDQMEKSRVVTEDVLPKLQSKTLFGNDYVLGDIILYGVFLKDFIEVENEYPRISSEIETLVPYEIIMLEENYEFMEIKGTFPCFVEKLKLRNRKIKNFVRKVQENYIKSLNKKEKK